MLDRLRQRPPHVAAKTTFGRFPARAITRSNSAGLLVSRTVSSFLPSAVIRTNTLRRRCRSIPTTCGPSYASDIRASQPGGDGCVQLPASASGGRPAPSSHQTARSKSKDSGSVIQAHE